VAAGGTLSYTAVLRNDGPFTVTACLSNTLPASLTISPGSLTGPGAYDPGSRRIDWEGTLASGEAVTIGYRVTMATGVPTGALVVNPIRLGLEEQGIRFHRAVIVRAGAPDLSPSGLACAPFPALPGGTVTCTLILANAGPALAPLAAVTDVLPAAVALAPGSLAWRGGGGAGVLPGMGGLYWTGTLTAGHRVTVSYQLTMPAALAHPPLYSMAFIEDGVGGEWERFTWLGIEPLRRYLPLVLRGP
jgi:uncharacterized repeat protein (TIGR01451 family)